MNNHHVVTFIFARRNEADLDEGIGVADGAAVVGDQVGDFVLGHLHLISVEKEKEKKIKWKRAKGERKKISDDDFSGKKQIWYIFLGA